MLTDLQRLKGIIEDLKTATEPDRELDVMITVAVDWKERDFDPDLMTARQLADRHGLTWLVNSCHSSTSIWRNIPRYTSSYDAAFSLAGAETNRRIECGTYEDGSSWAYAHLSGPGFEEVCVDSVDAFNEPTAITIALLQAHAARLEAQAEEAEEVA